MPHAERASDETSGMPLAPVSPLSANQERKLVDYLDEKFLDVTRNYKKRLDSSSSLRTLASYLEATHHLLFLILQIPPVNPSGPLRTTLLLRLTGEVMQDIPGYPPDVETLPLLLAWLSDLDHGWLAVLRAQGWDSDASSAMDVVLPPGAQCKPVSQTERTRLRSLLISGSDRLEEWLEGLPSAGTEGGLEKQLERLGLEQGFNELFSGTLAEMGSLGGTMSDPHGTEGIC